MRKLIFSIFMFCPLSIQPLLMISCQNNKNDKLYERLLFISEIATILGITDSKNLPQVRPFFDENNKLAICEKILNNINNIDYLNNIFLDKKRAKNDFSFKFLTSFLKLTPNKNDEFDLSDILLKVDDITYLKTVVKTFSDKNEKDVIFTEGIISFSFENRTNPDQSIVNFSVPILDLEVNAFAKIFNDRYVNKDDHYSEFINADRDLIVNGFNTGEKIENVKITFRQDSELVVKLATILKNFKLELDNLIRFKVMLNRENSNNSDCSCEDKNLITDNFKCGDYLDIELILSIPIGDINQNKNSRSVLSTIDFSINLTKGPL